MRPRMARFSAGSAPFGRLAYNGTSSARPDRRQSALVSPPSLLYRVPELPRLRPAAVRRRSLGHRPLQRLGCGERLETRHLLAAALVGQWQADDLNAGHDDLDTVTVWNDTVNGAAAVASGKPTLVKDALEGRSVVRFNRADGVDTFLLSALDNPLAGADDFSVAIAFATNAQTLNGGNTTWFLNTGLVDSTDFFGTTADWGVVMTSEGRIGGGLGQPATTVYSSEVGLNDGLPHVAIYTRQGDTISVYVDAGLATSQSGGGTAPRNLDDVTFGAIQGGSFAFTGDIAEIRFYDGAFSSTEATDISLEMQARYGLVRPTAFDDAYSTAEDQPLIVAADAGVLSNDRNIEVMPLSATLVDPPQHGMLTLAADGSFVYEPEPNFFGPDSFTYRANNGGDSNLGLATIDVAAVLDPTVAVPDTYIIDAPNILQVSAADGVLANDSNNDQRTLSAVLVRDVPAGLLTLRPDGSFDYDPLGHIGSVTFAYLINDSLGNHNVVDVTLRVDTPPEAGDDVYVRSNADLFAVPASSGLLANDTDAEGDPLTAELISPPSQGRLRLFQDGSFSYQPLPGAAGDDAFSYRVSDGDQFSLPASVSLTLPDINPLPPLELDPRGDAVVTFNELQYHPADGQLPGAAAGQEWLELHNQMAVDVDLSGWSLTGGIDYQFAAGTVLPAGGYLVVAASPSLLTAVAAVGPYQGQLSNQGEEVWLVDNNGRVMDILEYGDGSAERLHDTWPVGADGSGATLAKRKPSLSSQFASNWSTSLQLGGTPGRENFPQLVHDGSSRSLVALEGEWWYQDNGLEPGDDWKQLAFDPTDPDGDPQTLDAWQRGFAALGSEGQLNLPIPLQTIIDPVPTTTYFRTEFDYAATFASFRLDLGYLVDDGAVIYLNGTEVARDNLPAGDTTPDTRAIHRQRTAAAGIVVPAELLVAGTNVLAVEVHQAVSDATGPPVENPAGLVIAAAPSFAITWDGNDGDFFDESVNAPVPNNLALAANGATPFATGELGVGIHFVQTLNDGRYGNSYSWISSNVAEPFAGINFGQLVEIERVAWGRDNGRLNPPAGDEACGGQCADRWAGLYTLQFTTVAEPGVDTPLTGDPATGWQTIGTFDYQQVIDSGVGGGFTPYLRHEYDVRQNGSSLLATGLRLLVPNSSIAIDEIEAYGEPREQLLHAASLVITEQLEPIVVPPLEFQEVAAAGESFWVELLNTGESTLDLTGFQLVGSASAAQVSSLPASHLPAGERLVVTAAQLGFSPAAGNRLFLLGAGGETFVDAVLVGDQPRGRSTDHDARWLLTETATPGESNLFALRDEIVIHEIQYHAQPYHATDELPFVEASQEWIELYNRSDHAVDLSGWQLAGGIDYTLPIGTFLNAGDYLVVANHREALAHLYPTARIVGDFSRSLNNGSDTILLFDALGNLADEVTYFDRGRWPQFADGGGATLELRDAWADNRRPEAWAASEEWPRSRWQTVTYRGIADNSGFTTVSDRYHEFIFGLLDAGEFLIDDISLIESPAGEPIERIQNGSFEDDILGEPASTWRIGGNHGGQVVIDPDDPQNQVLHVTASGALEDRLNHAETTLADGARIVRGREYEISFRAKWLAGSPQLNTHLFFNTLPRTTLLETPARSGTPGRPNSRQVDNLGPTYAQLSHTPAVPAENEPVTVAVEVDDPQGVSAVDLYYSVNAGAWQSVAMSVDGNGTYRGSIPGQSTASIVQFYVEGRDAAGGLSQFPAAGPDARALYKVEDNQAASGPLHNFRIVMTAADTARLHDPTLQTSNGRLGATVIYNESEVFYDVGVRLKGSNAGRGNNDFLSFNVQFDPTQLFRDTHETVAIDRSGRSAPLPLAQDEILIKHLGNHASGVASRYNDLVHVIAPNPIHTRTALLMMARYGDIYLDSQFAGGSDGTVYKLDIAYVANNTTDGNPESPKIVFPYSHPSPAKDIQDLGDDKERYRSHLFIRNNRSRDDFSQMIAAGQALRLSGDELLEAAADVIDVDQWARTFAVQSLSGAVDVYSRTTLHHNIVFYVRPEDNRVLALPWDWDFAFQNGISASLLGPSSNATKLLQLPANLRRFHGHLLDIIENTYNNAYLDRWIDHYGEVADQDFSHIKNYVNARAGFVRSQLPAVIPFEITSGGGADFDVDEASVTLSGRGWINVHQIRRSGSTQPLDVHWIDAETWELTLPLAPGANPIALEAINYRGEMVGEAAVTVTSTGGDRPLFDGLRISEVHYNPAAPSASETLAGHSDNDDFEFIELINIGAEVLDLGSVRLTRTDLAGQLQGVDFDFATAAVQSLEPGQRIVVVEDSEAFAARYGHDSLVAGEWMGRLSNNTEQLTLQGNGFTIQSFAYDDDWHPATDGNGSSLEIVDATSADLGRWSMAAGWQPSRLNGGTPGRPNDALSERGDFDTNGRVDAGDIDLLQSEIQAGSHHATFDLTNDGRVDEQDLDELVFNLLGTQPGDANLDGSVTALADGQVLLSQLGRTDLGWAAGDFDGDGQVTASRDGATLLAALAADQASEPKDLQTARASAFAAGEFSDAEARRSTWS